MANFWLKFPIFGSTKNLIAFVIEIVEDKIQRLFFNSSSEVVYTVGKMKIEIET